MSQATLDGLLRAVGTLVAALLALPLVAWLEGLRGKDAATGPVPGVVVGPRGAFTALATAIKLLEKRSPRSIETDRLLHTSSPVLAIVPTLAVPAIIPLTPHDPVRATLSFLLALSLLSTGAIALAGFGSGSRLAHLAALRLVCLRLSVLVVVATAALAPASLAESVDLLTIVRAQAQPLVGLVPRWACLVAPMAFVAAVVALAIHAQHVLRARTEPSLAEPWMGDATGPVLLGLRVFESLDLVAGACILATVFLGGWHIPGVAAPFQLVCVAKIALALVAIIVARNALPVLTPAVALRVCWLVLVPLALVGLAILRLVDGAL